MQIRNHNDPYHHSSNQQPQKLNDKSALIGALSTDECPQVEGNNKEGALRFLDSTKPKSFPLSRPPFTPHHRTSTGTNGTKLPPLKLQLIRSSSNASIAQSVSSSVRSCQRSVASTIVLTILEPTTPLKGATTTSSTKKSSHHKSRRNRISGISDKPPRGGGAGQSPPTQQQQNRVLAAECRDDMAEQSADAIITRRKSNLSAPPHERGRPPQSDDRREGNPPGRGLASSSKNSNGTNSPSKRLDDAKDPTGISLDPPYQQQQNRNSQKTGAPPVPPKDMLMILSGPANKRSYKKSNNKNQAQPQLSKQQQQQPLPPQQPPKKQQQHRGSVEPAESKDLDPKSVEGGGSIARNVCGEGTKDMDSGKHNNETSNEIPQSQEEALRQSLEEERLPQEETAQPHIPEEETAAFATAIVAASQRLSSSGSPLPKNENDNNDNDPSSLLTFSCPAESCSMPMTTIRRMMMTSTMEEKPEGEQEVFSHPPTIETTDTPPSTDTPFCSEATPVQAAMEQVWSHASQKVVLEMANALHYWWTCGEHADSSSSQQQPAPNPTTRTKNTASRSHSSSSSPPPPPPPQQQKQQKQIMEQRHMSPQEVEYQKPKENTQQDEPQDQESPPPPLEPSDHQVLAALAQPLDRYASLEEDDDLWTDPNLEGHGGSAGDARSEPTTTTKQVPPH